MDKRRLFLRGILCIAIMAALAGCQKKPENAAKTGETNRVRNTSDGELQEAGGYVEEEIKMPGVAAALGEEICGVFIGRDQSWKVYVAKWDYPKTERLAEASLYTKPFRNGGGQEEGWEKEPADWIKKAFNSCKVGKNFSKDLPVITEGEDGKDYLFIRCRHVAENKDQMIVIRMDNKTGKAASLKLKGDFSDSFLLDKTAITEDGSIVLSSGKKGLSYVYSGKDGGLLKTVDLGVARVESEYRDRFVAEIKAQGNWLIGQGTEGLACYDMEQKKIVKTYPYDFPGGSDICFSAGKAGGYLIGDRKGLHHIGRDGTLWETIIEGFQTSYGLGQCSMKSIYLLGEKEDEFAAVFYGAQTDTGYKLARYVYDETKPVVNQTFTIYSLYYNASIQEYINCYQMKHKDVRVDYNVGKKNGGLPDEDYIRALNTELLNGKGPDVIVLDGLPVQSYIKNGVLDDIGNVVKPILDSGKLLENVVSPYIQDNGEMYRVPLQLRLPWVIGNKEVVACLGNMEKMAEYITNGDGTAFTEKMSYEALASMLLSFEYTSLVRAGEPDIQRMARFLKGLKTAAENTGAVEHLSNEAVIRDRTSGAGFDVDFADSSYKDYTAHLLEGKIEMAVPELRNLLNTGNGIWMEKNKGLTFEIFGNSFIPMQFIGINNSSKQKKLALNFIQYILEEEPEEYLKSLEPEMMNRGIWLYHWGYIPVAKIILDEQMNCLAAVGSKMGMVEANGKQYTVKTEPEDYKALLEEIKTLDQPMEVDQKVFDMVVDGAVSCLAGRVTAEQAANDICNKIRLYQAERE